jgi:hypothetical protein
MRRIITAVVGTSMLIAILLGVVLAWGDAGHELRRRAGRLPVDL